MRTLDRARFVLSDARDPPVAGGETITLPDPWAIRRAGTAGDAWYLLDWTLAAKPDVIQGIYLTATTLSSQIYVNGERVGATGDLHGPAPNGWQRSVLVPIPADVLRAGSNVIAIHVRQHSAGFGGMGAVLAGPETTLRDRALADFVKFTLGPVIVSVTITAMGLFIFVLWARRREPAYGLFAAAAMLWGVHTMLSLLPQPFLPLEHWAVWWNFLYMLVVVLLCLFCLSFAEVRWRIFRRVAVVYTALIPIVLYAAIPLGVLSAASIAVRLFGLALTFVALAAIARYSLQQRNTESVLLFFAGALALSLGVHDWLLAQDRYIIRPLWLAPYAALGFLTLVGWILTDRFVQALNQSEVLNASLEQRVAEKSAALAEQLAVTRDARDAAERSDRAKSSFLAAASHDLRQPLHALGLFAAQLQGRTRDHEDMALAQRITTSVSSLDHLFSALLDVSKLEAGVVIAEMQPVRLQPLFDRLANDFAPEAIEADLKLAVVPTRVQVRSDPVLLERILRNLVANALRYSKNGGVVIGCRRRHGRIVIEVWDSGCGIPRDDLERIFEEFYQVGIPARATSRGMGLGLAIVRGLADLLGHRIRVSSQPGRGTVFRVEAERAHVDADDPLSSPMVPRDVFTGQRVGVIDDEEPVRAATRQMLLAWGCAPIVAADADEMITRCVGSGPPAALILDFRLGDGQDGLDAIARLRAAWACEVPTVLVSGESSATELARIKASGHLLLHKPATPAKLRAMLFHLLALPLHATGVKNG